MTERSRRMLVAGNVAGLVTEVLLATTVVHRMAAEAAARLRGQ